MPFPIETRKEVWLALRADGALGSGSAQDPYDSSSPGLFDDRMNSFQANTTIHLGPGVFQTRGSTVWNPKSGWRFIGAGIDATIIKLALKPDAAVHSTDWALDTGNHLDGFEAPDFIVDCNLDGQVINGYITFPPVTCGAISLTGRNTRLRRIRFINFGTLDKTYESFPIIPNFAFPNLPEAVNGVIEGCIIEKPSVNNAGTISCINNGSTEDQPTGAKAYHRSCVIRNCVLDCEYADNPVAVSGISVSGTTATVTTELPHHRTPGQWVVITGALVDGSPANDYNGSYQITAVSPDPRVFTYTLVDYTGAGLPTVSPTGDMYVGKFPSHIIPIQNISLDPVTLIATLTTAGPHNRVMRNTVNVFNVSLPIVGVHNAFNDSFQILAILSPTQLTYPMTSNPGSPNIGSAFIGSVFQPLSADGGTGTIVEGNRVYNARVGGPYHDTFSTKDIVIRNNHYYSVVAGPYQNMGSVSINFNTGQLRFSITAMTRGGPDNQTATFTTPLPHGFVGGEPVQIKGANEAQYNGTFAIAVVLSPTQFTYRMDSPPPHDATGVSFTYGVCWQTGRWIVEDNIIELVISNSGYGSPIAIDVYDGQNSGPHGSQYQIGRA